MNELQRQHYLDAMGIESYMPRWILPCAPDPERCEAPVALPKAAPANPETPANLEAAPSQASPSAEVGAAAPVEVAVKPEMAAVASVVAEKRMVDAAAPASSKEPEPLVRLLDEAPPANTEGAGAATPSAENDTSESAETEVQNVSFALGLWRISEELVVIDSRQAELALPVDALLVNILAALGYPRANIPKVEVIRWPRVENAFTDKSAVAARAMVSAMIGAKLEMQPAKYLLLLGAEACHYVLPAEVLAEDKTPQQSLERLSAKAVRLDEMDCSAIIAPSLTDMLQEPSSKAITWRAIQPLRLA